jgi:hypothetical protein
MPELVEVITAEMVADAVTALLAEPARLEAMRARLRELYADSWGAAGRLLEVVYPTLRLCSALPA